MASITNEEREHRKEVVVSQGYDQSLSQEWYQRYNTHLHTASKRGLQSDLSFEEYVAKAKEAGIEDPNQLGSFSGQYHLGRLGDQGDYTKDSCRFITSNQNHREAFDNGRNDARIEASRGETKETSGRARKISEAHLGRTKETHQYLADRSAQQTGRTKETHAYLAEKGPKISESKAKEFVATSPDGIIHEGRHLGKFCEEHGLTPSGMSAVCNGRWKHHKGWTAEYKNGSKDESAVLSIPEK